MTAVYPGATAEDVAEAVAAPIEQQLSSMDGLLYFKSSNGSDGTMNLSVYFDISRDQDLAAVDVQNQVKLAEPQLPEEVRRQGITVKKSQPDILLMIALDLRRPALRRRVPHQLLQDQPRGRGQAHQGRGRRLHLRPARVLDAALSSIPTGWRSSA